MSTKRKRSVADYVICAIGILFFCAYLSAGCQPVSPAEQAAFEPAAERQLQEQIGPEAESSDPEPSDAAATSADVAQSDVNANADVAEKAQQEAAAQAQVKTEAQAQVEAESPQPAAEPQPQVEPQPQAETQSQVEAQPQQQVQPQSKTVVVAPSGKKYHNPGCRTLSGSKSLTELTEGEAIAMDYGPCGVCKP